jgi:cell wall-associated NlpC family hydrolase
MMLKNKLLLSASLLLCANLSHAQFGDILRGIKDAAKKQQQQGSTQPVTTEATGAPPTVAPSAPATPAAPATESTPATAAQAASPSSQFVQGQVGSSSDLNGARFGPTAKPYEQRRSGNIAWIHTENTVLVTSRKPRNLQDAQAAAITEVKDGDPLWLYIKTARPLNEYLRNDPDSRVPEKERTYEINVIMETPIAHGGSGAFSRNQMAYPVTAQEMRGTELSIAMSPRGVKADSGTMSRPVSDRIYREAYIFMKTFGHSETRRGVYPLAFYVEDNMRPTAGLDRSGVPQFIGVAEFTVNVPDGLSKYKKLQELAFDCSSKVKTSTNLGPGCVLQ